MGRREHRAAAARQSEQSLQYAVPFFCVSLGRRDGLIQMAARDGSMTGRVLTDRRGAWFKFICRSTMWALKMERIGISGIQWVRSRPASEIEAPGRVDVRIRLYPMLGRIQMKHLPRSRPRAGSSGRSRAIRCCAVVARGSHQGDGGDSQHVQSQVFARRQAHRVPQQSQRDAASVDGRCCRRRAGRSRRGDPVQSVEWSPVEDRIAYDVARGGGFNSQVYYSKPDGTDAKRITSGGKEDNFSGSFAPDGRYYFRSAQRVRRRRIRGSTIPRPASLRLQSSTTGSAASSTSAARQSRVDQPSRHTRQQQSVSARSADARGGLLTPHEGPALVGGELAPDGSAVYLVHNLGRDRQVVSRIPIDAAGKPGAMTLLAERDDAERTVSP